MTENDLLAGIATHPDELERWLILSDWLEDHGDPRCELARLRYLFQTEPDHPEHRTRWQALHASGLAPVVPTLTNALGMTFALILPGMFQMGSPASEAGRFNNETLHTVELTEPFYMGVYPVTVGEFEAFVAAKGYQTETERAQGAYGWTGSGWAQDRKYSWRNHGFAQTARHPVVCVSWDDAQAMVTWLNETDKDGLVYALPTEAEWEYACRAGTQTAFWWGDDISQLGAHAWYYANSGDRNHPVETKDANPWGLYHMLGHVWEWCEDWYDNLPSRSTGDPAGPAAGSGRAVRGGIWYGSTGCLAGYDVRSDANEVSATIGFRLLVSLRP